MEDPPLGLVCTSLISLLNICHHAVNDPEEESEPEPLPKPDPLPKPEPAYKTCTATGKNLKKKDLEFCLKRTRFDEKTVLFWFRSFRFNLEVKSLDQKANKQNQISGPSVPMGNCLEATFCSSSPKFFRRAMPRASVSTYSGLLLYLFIKLQGEPSKQGHIGTWVDSNL